MRPLSLSRAVHLLDGLQGSVVGVGVTAFPRAGLVDVIPSYRIVCLRKTGDLRALRRKTPVFCLEEDSGGEPGPGDSFRLLSHPATRKYLGGLPKPVHLLLYQSTPELEDLARTDGWHLLANPGALRIRTSDRAFFQGMVNRLDFPIIPGGMSSLKRFVTRSYAAWAEELGPRLAIQLPDITQGGGRSTFFVKSAEDYQGVVDRIRGASLWGKRLNRVLVRRTVDGEPASISVCVTPRGALVAGFQSQIIDPPFARGVPAQGVFFGHSWGGSCWPGAVEREARRLGGTVGRILGSMGYRGILGLDVVVMREEGMIYPVELNPRLTAAFPLVSRLQVKNGEAPVELFHVLSFLAPSLIPEDAGVVERREIRGGQILLFRGLGEKPLKPLPEAGLYSISGDSLADLHFMGEAWEMTEAGDGDSFVLTDGPPEGSLETADPLFRMGRLLFASPVQEPGGRLTARAGEAVERVLARIFGQP